MRPWMLGLKEVLKEVLVHVHVLDDVIVPGLESG